MKDFALIGAAGFVASRHLQAISETGNRLVAACDPNESVGILDRYFPDAAFFREFERFDLHLERLRRRGSAVDYVGICSPNYLHAAHMHCALRHGAHAICEKPLVLDSSDLDLLGDLEREHGRRVYTILQLRLHPAVQALRNKVLERLAREPSFRPQVALTYITSRGSWYHASWKADAAKSGGVTSNIGIHFFDMLLWIFGSVQESRLERATPSSAAGQLTLAHADVTWQLSIDAADLPPAALARGQRTHRSLQMEGEEVEFSEGFTDLHTASYRHILGGGGFGIADARAAVELVAGFRR
ncbi:MAG: Gfo/Idh/MocA family oxidoreductase [Myxococcales bacterium]